MSAASSSAAALAGLRTSAILTHSMTSVTLPSPASCSATYTTSHQPHCVCTVHLKSVGLLMVGCLNPISRGFRPFCKTIYIMHNSLALMLAPPTLLKSAVPAPLKGVPEIFLLLLLTHVSGWQHLWKEETFEDNLNS